MKTKMIIAVIALMLRSVGAAAQTQKQEELTDETFAKLLQASIPKTQRLLKGFGCPEGASPKACQSFQELVTAGDKIVATAFILMQRPRKHGHSAVYVMFDDSSDNFWLLSILGTADENDKNNLYLGFIHYQKGFIVRASSENVPLNVPLVLPAGFSKDGVSI